MSEQPVVSFDSLLPVRIVKRLNRFVVAVELDGEVVQAHLPNSGRLKELVYPGNVGYVERRAGGNRKTEYELLLVESMDNLVSLEANAASRFAFKAVKEGLWSEFSEVSEVKREVRVGHSRLDLVFKKDQLDWYAEVKSVTLVSDGIARFPDAPTLRGIKHVRELIDLREKGYGAAIFFVLGRSDAIEFRPNWVMDLDFSRAIVKADEANVLIRAYSVNVTREGIFSGREIFVNLSESKV